MLWLSLTSAILYFSTDDSGYARLFGRRHWHGDGHLAEQPDWLGLRLLLGFLLLVFLVVFFNITSINWSKTAVAAADADDEACEQMCCILLAM